MAEYEIVIRGTVRHAEGRDAFEVRAQCDDRDELKATVARVQERAEAVIRESRIQAERAEAAADA